MRIFRPFAKKNQIRNRAEDGAVGDVEDWIGVFVEDEIEHIDHMAVDKVVEDVAEGSCGDHEERNTEILGRLKKEQIGEDASCDDDPQDE